VEKDMLRAAYKNIWRKMEVVTQKRAQDGKEWSVTADVLLGVTRLKSRK